MLRNIPLLLPLVTLFGLMLGACASGPKTGPTAESFNLDIHLISPVVEYAETRPHFSDNQVMSVVQFRVGERYAIYHLNVDYTIPRKLKWLSRKEVTVAGLPCSNGVNWFLPTEISKEDKEFGILGSLIVLDYAGVTPTESGWWKQRAWMISLNPKDMPSSPSKEPDPADGPFCT